MPLGPSGMFYSGLAGLVGMTDPQVLTMEAMRQEHCESADAARPFVSAKHGIHTCSLVEWWFVFDPEGASQPPPPPEARDALAAAKAALGLAAHKWPLEAERTVEIDRNTGRAPEGAWLPRKPESRTSLRLEERKRLVNGQLRKVGEGALSPEEFVAARLYTGPMGDKYDLVCAALGTRQLAGLPREARVGVVSAEAEAQLLRPGSGTRDALATLWTSACEGNTYTTTLTTLSHAIGKLGRISKAGAPLYRPLDAPSALPPALLGGGFGPPLDAPTRRALCLLYTSPSPRDS